MPINVVIVDDHKMVREGIRQLLEFDGKIKVIGEAGNGLEFLEYLEKNDKLNAEKIDAEITKASDYITEYSKVRNIELNSIVGRNIARVEDYDLGIYKENGQVGKLTLPNSLVVKYIFDDGGWFVLRPSGTEPKLKVYISIVCKTEAESKALVESLKDAVSKIIDEVE